MNFNGLICIYIELYLSISNIPKQLQCDLIKDFESEKGIVYRNVWYSFFLCPSKISTIPIQLQAVQITFNACNNHYLKYNEHNIPAEQSIICVNINKLNLTKHHWLLPIVYETILIIRMSIFCFNLIFSLASKRFPLWAYRCSQVRRSWIYLPITDIISNYVVNCVLKLTFLS